MTTSRELIKNTLEFKNTDRVARDLWTLPWAERHYPGELAAIRADFPSDFGGAPARLREQTVERGDPHEIGEYIDKWGCKFHNIAQGVIGEVREPLVKDDDWADADRVRVPEELLSFDIAEYNAERAKVADKFVIAGSGYPIARPFEQLQFLRGSENLYVDLADPPAKMSALLEKMHDFYCRYMTKWARTDADALFIMDDWGSQKSLLISPATWRKIFKPLYRDYIAIAKKHGKKAFMHSDGYILDIIPDLIDLGLDAINSQIFCMGIENLRQFKGKLTFWGEIDRQHLLPNGTREDIRRAVRLVRDTLYANGGCIAQCEFGPGAKPENVREVFAAWNE